MRRPDITWKHILLTLLALAGLLLLWRVMPGPPIAAQVVDAQTGQPVAGAVVVGVWTREAGLPGLYYGKLVGVKEAVTDAQGNFTLSRPWSLWSLEESVTVYKAGYIARNNLFLYPFMEKRQAAGLPPRIPLELFPQGGSHQQHVSFIDNVTTLWLYSLDDVPRLWSTTQQERRMP